MAKALKILLIISLLTLTCLLPIFSTPAHAEEESSNIPVPGTCSVGKDFTNIKSNINVTFYDNEAYPEWASETYIYMTQIWAGAKNQEVKIQLNITHITAEGSYMYFSDKNGRNFVDSSGSGSEAMKKMRAKLLQESNWRNQTYNIGNGDTGYIKPTSVTIGNLPPTGYTTNDAYISALWLFDTNTSYFKPGVFEIIIQIEVVWKDWFNPFSYHTAWETIAVMYGEFSWGEIKNNPPTQDLNNTGKTTISGHVYTGDWDIQFWYASSGWDNGAFDSYNVTQNGVVDSDGVAKMMKDFGTFSPKNPDYNLTYTFNASDPTGIYLWVFYSKFTDGKVLAYFSIVVHNNASSLNQGTYPDFKITFLNKGEINQNLKIRIEVTNWNGTPVQAVLIAYYGSQVNFIPPNNGGIAVLYFNLPIEINNKSLDLTMRMKSGGEFNVIVMGVFSGVTAIGIGTNYTIVQSFEGAPGGFETENPWIKFPWQSTTNMIILLVGVIFMFSGNRTFQIIGVLLFFASFINWTYAAHYIQTQFNPIPRLQIWGWWR